MEHLCLLVRIYQSGTIPLPGSFLCMDLLAAASALVFVDLQACYCAAGLGFGD